MSPTSAPGDVAARSTSRARGRRCAGSGWRAQEGMVAGFEALAFGVLVFVFGTLMVLHGWAVIDARFATAAAAREAVRAVIQAPAAAGPGELEGVATGAAAQALLAHGYEAEPVLVEAQLGRTRCATVAVTVELMVAATVVPGIAGAASYPVRSRHAQLVEPFRAGLGSEDGFEACATSPDGGF